MTWDASVSRAHPTTPPCVQLGLLATANLLAAVGGGVALAFGLVVTAATIALLLMMLGSMQFLGGAVTTVTGLALTAWLVQHVKTLDDWDGSLRQAVS